MADGLRTSLGERPFSVIRRQVDAIITATEPEILEAMRFVWERFKMIIEPSCAVPVAPVLNQQFPVEGLRVGIIITGGNVDLEPMFQALAAKWL
jgi:threonine dehydratase